MSGAGPLHERRDAMGLVASEAERARAGTGRLVLLRGASGTGRTALLEAVTDHASTHGMRVLRARCSPDASTVPFDTVLQLLGSGPECDQASDEALLGDPDSRSRPARLWQLLLSYGARTPLLVTVDDVHCADDRSRRWLVEAARRIDQLPILIVVTERSQYDIDSPSPSLAHTLSPALVRTHTLAPLSANAAAELVRSVHGGAPQEWVDDCVRAGAGSPLLLRALLDDLRAECSDGAPTPPVPNTCAALYPGSYPAAVAWWLDSAGPATTDVARALAALDAVGPGGPEDGFDDGFEDGCVELLAEMADADPSRVSGWLTAMTRLGLLRPAPDGRPRYAHPLLRDAVLSGWTNARRQAAHRTAAEAMLRRGDRAEAVAVQLLRTRPVGEEWAIGVLLDAAALAVQNGRSGDAMAFLRRTLDEPMPATRRALVLTELGSLEYITVRSTAGIPRLTEALRLPGPPQGRVRTAVALGTALARQGDARSAVGVLRDLDEQLTDHPDLVRTVQTASAALSDHDPGVRQEVYRWLRATAERSPESVGTAGQALLVRYESTAGLTSAASAMRRIRALLAQPADPLAEAFLLGTAAAVAQWADRLDEAERLVERGLAGQRTSLLHPMHMALLNVRTDIAAARGAYAELLADSGVWRLAGSRQGPANAQAQALVALVKTGRTDEAVRRADSLEPRNPHDSWELNRFLYARGVLHAAAGDPAGALDDFLECGRRQSSRDVTSPVVTPWRTAAAECHLALGRPREALDLAQEELRLAMVWNTPRLVGRALRVLGTATGGSDGLALADRAVQVLQDATVDVELIPALVAQGRLLTAADERPRARTALREAAERAERLGSVRMRDVAEAALHESGARRTARALTGAGALTGSERRIASLAADGRTNTEIAELLHLARRTVESHLTSSYRKLGIRRRTELTAALASRSTPS